MATEEEAVVLEPYEAEEDSVDEAKPIRWWARSILLVLTAPWIAVFIVAIALDPYDSDDGGARKMGTHMQLGLPDCNFKVLTQLPCPSCGMTTSFSLLLHADVWNSMQANFAGTALAAFGLFFIPWALASAFFGRFMFVRSLEMVIFRLAIVFLVLLFGRWGLILIFELLN
jgi:hypothetical protein